MSWTYLQAQVIVSQSVDTLVILDCCFSAQGIIPETTTGIDKTLDFITASASNELAWSGIFSFTRILTRALQFLEGRAFTISDGPDSLWCTVRQMKNRRYQEIEYYWQVEQQVQTARGLNSTRYKNHREIYEAEIDQDLNETQAQGLPPAFEVATEQQRHLDANPARPQYLIPG